jgi:serine/threonine protein kinase
VVVDANAGVGRGTRVGRYEIEDFLGSTPLATVYRARDLERESYVALKRSSGPTDAARWEIEARLLSELDHPGVASLVDHFEEPPGTYNLAMSLVDGTDLRRVLWDRGTPGLPIRDVVRWMGDACQALQYLHDQQIVHGDVKPGNLILGHRRVVLVDFGVASQLAGDTYRARGGTPRFMAPEVFLGSPPRRAATCSESPRQPGL